MKHIKAISALVLCLGFVMTLTARAALVKRDTVFTTDFHGETSKSKHLQLDGDNCDDDDDDDGNPE